MAAGALPDHNRVTATGVLPDHNRVMAVDVPPDRNRVRVWAAVLLDNSRVKVRAAVLPDNSRVKAVAALRANQAEDAHQDRRPVKAVEGVMVVVTVVVAKVATAEGTTSSRVAVSLNLSAAPGISEAMRQRQRAGDCRNSACFSSPALTAPAAHALPSSQTKKSARRRKDDQALGFAAMNELSVGCHP